VLRTRIISWTLFSLTVVLVPAAAVLGILSHQRHLEGTHGSSLLLVGLGGPAALLFAAVGLLIARTEPRNAIGWIFLGSAALLAANLAAYGYTDLALDGEPWPATRWTAAFTYWSFIPAVFVTPALVAQLFPNGSPLAGRWRVVFWACLLYGTLASVSAIFAPSSRGSYPQLQNPAANVALLGSIGGGLDGAGPMIAPVVFAVSVAALVTRFRRSTGIQRQQMKWLASAGAVPVVFFGLSFVTELIDSSSAALDAVFATGFASLMLVPVAVGIAIRRYRLYEIDRVISRTLVYGSLTVVLGAAYALLVLAGQAIFSSVAGGSNLAVAASTLVVAALFLPLRSRLQRIVDRRFYRRRYDAQRTIDAFASRLRHEVELTTLCRDLQSVVNDTVQPRQVSLWLRGRA
jgi:hypothetical protein